MSATLAVPKWQKGWPNRWALRPHQQEHTPQMKWQRTPFCWNPKAFPPKEWLIENIDDMEPLAYDMVISMGCGVHCPAIQDHQDWELEDPVGQAYEVYEATAAEIERRLTLLLDQDS